MQPHHETELVKTMARIAKSLEQIEKHLLRMKFAMDDIATDLNQDQAADGKKEIYGDKSEE